MSGWRGIAVGAALAWLLLQPGVAAAHAEFTRAEPAANTTLAEPPRQIQLWFSEPIEPGFSAVEVVDARRQRVDAGVQAVPDDPASLIVALRPLETGAYTVRWRVLSAVDGHVTRGVFSVLVGVESAEAPPPPPATETSTVFVAFEAAQRWLSYLAGAALVGAFLFRLVVLQPVARRLGLASLAAAARPPLDGLAWLCLAVLAFAHAEALALQLAAVSPASEGAALRAALGQLLLSTRYGTVWLVRLGLLAALALLLAWRRGERPAASWWGATALGAGLLLTTSLNSHSASVSGLSVVPVAVDWLHLLAAAVWVGGLFSLVLVLPGSLRAARPADRAKLLAALVPRFSTLALGSVAVLVGTGLFSTWLHVGSLGALLETLYGQSLLVKLALIAPLLLLGAINLLVSRPQLAAAAGAARAAERPARRFRRLVLGEAILAALVLLAAGVLTSLPPARQAYQQLLASRPLAMSAQAGGLTLDLTITPARPGLNTFTLLVRDAAGRPIDNAERVDLRFTYLDEAVGTAIATAEAAGQGRYQARGPFVGVVGRWQIETLVRQPGQDDVLAAFRFRVSAEGAEAEQPGQASASLRWPPITPATALALGLVALGLALVIYVSRGIGLRSAEGRLLALASLAVVGLGGYLFVRPLSAELTSANVVNPIAPTADSLQTGEAVYRTHCQVCHGPQGRGDGPAAAALSPRPADLRVHMAEGHTDGEIFVWVSDGIPGTAMPGFADRLSEEERWHVINFIKSFALSSGP